MHDQTNQTKTSGKLTEEDLHVGEEGHGAQGLERVGLGVDLPGQVHKLFLFWKRGCG